MKKNNDKNLSNDSEAKKININSTLKNNNNNKTNDYIIESRKDYFDSGKIKILSDFIIEDNILILYSTNLPFCLGCTLFNKDSKKLIYRTANPIFTSDDKITRIKLKLNGNDLEMSFSRNGNTEKTIFPIDYLLGRNLQKNKSKYDILPKCIIKKIQNNPVISPNVKNNWESCGTFNPAILEIDGVTHILYRAVGGDGGSVIGYAVSRDGIHIDERLSYPIYRPTAEFELRVSNNPLPEFNYSSGDRYDCWGGCEDPRAVVIDDRIYMIYTAFNGVRPPCVAMTSIKISDFLSRNWNAWKKPVLVSPEGKMNKNWVVFPEKINGKYAIIHSITPKIQIEYLDNLDFEKNPNIKSIYERVKNENTWDTFIRGVGATPLRIDEGWLVFYHAISENEPSKYKIGAMILDYKDPTKILYKSSFPIIEPTEKYENEGYKGGIVYTCGATIKGDDLILYYGGADTVVCIAMCNLKEFIQQIKDNNGKIY